MDRPTDRPSKLNANNQNTATNHKSCVFCGTQHRHLSFLTRHPSDCRQSWCENQTMFGRPSVASWIVVAMQKCTLRNSFDCASHDEIFRLPRKPTKEAHRWKIEDDRISKRVRWRWRLDDGDVMLRGSQLHSKFELLFPAIALRKKQATKMMKNTYWPFRSGGSQSTTACAPSSGPMTFLQNALQLLFINNKMHNAIRCLCSIRFSNIFKLYAVCR